MVSKRSAFIAVCFCFLLSGSSALLYQIAWMRLFATVFGSTAVAGAAVLSAYMAGLALGAVLIGRHIDRIERPVLAYGVLEVVTALSAVAMPASLALIESLQAAAFGGAPTLSSGGAWLHLAFRWTAAFMLMAAPTICMGATLPLLTRTAVASDASLGPRVGALYAVNTSGAVLGALLCGFVLLPALGIKSTLWIGAALNLLVFLVVLCLPSGDERPAAPAATASPASTTAIVRWSSMILPLMLISGAVTFTYELLWSGLLSHLLGGSVIAFSTIIGSFLTGIALGGALGGRLATTRERALLMFALAQVGVGSLAVATLYLLERVPMSAVGFSANAMLGFLSLLPCATFIGSTFPLAVRIFARDQGHAAEAAAKVFHWNTVGGVAGAVGGALWLLPALRYEGALTALVVTNFLIAAVVGLTIVGRARQALTVLTAVLAIVLVAVGIPVPERILSRSPITDPVDGSPMFYAVGRSSDVTVSFDRGIYSVRSNGLPESGVLPKGFPPVRSGQRILGAMPVIVRPDVQSMLVVGFGGGVAVTGVPPTVARIDVIELEPRVLDANAAIAARREVDPLRDPRVTIHLSDARGLLMLSDVRYDAVVSQPSHPWTAGASHLYTAEYMALVRDRLQPEGVFVQWMNVEFVSAASLRSLFRSVLKVFPYARVYSWDPGELMLVASPTPLTPERHMRQRARPFADSPGFFESLGIDGMEHVVSALMLDEAGMRAVSGNAPLLTDDRNTLAMESATLLERGEALSAKGLSEMLRPHVPVLRAKGWEGSRYNDALDYAAIGERFRRAGLPSYANDLMERLKESGDPRALLMLGRGLLSQGDVLEGRRTLIAASDANPQDSRALYAALEPFIERRGEADMPDMLRRMFARLSGPAAAVVRASEAAKVGDWDIVRREDAALGAAGPRDPWFEDAVRLRIGWRGEATAADRQQRLQEAISIIDRAIALRPSRALFTMRLATAYAAGDPLLFMGSSWAVLRSVESEVLLPAESGVSGDRGPAIRAGATPLRNIRRILDGLGEPEGIERSEQAVLAAEIDRMIARFERL